MRAVPIKLSLGACANFRFGCHDMSTFEQLMDMWRVMYDTICMVQTQHAGHGKSYCAFCNNGFLRHVGYVDAEFGAGWYYDCWVARRTPGAVQLLPALFAGHRFLWLQLPRGLLGPRVPRIPWTTLRIPAWNMFPNWISRRRSPTAVGVKRKCAVFFLFRKTEVVRLEWKLAGTTSCEKGNHFIYFQCKERCFGSMPVNFFRVKTLCVWTAQEWTRCRLLGCSPIQFQCALVSTSEASASAPGATILGTFVDTPALVLGTSALIPGTMGGGTTYTEISLAQSCQSIRFGSKHFPFLSPKPVRLQVPGIFFDVNL